ncbi:hypothetical protein E2C01_057800 [Portunus trituberculatus]|uniref:Uncharacterized protein n=1 Tax=Portunus trituberculatus TaxID=210409 RepID=A0A5B7H3L8_PORTR|nr:hypothetical protein [Portunus trituberculatus]
MGSEECQIHEDSPICSVLMQTSKAFSPVDNVSCDVDKHVADMINQLFNHGMREDNYKEVAEDEGTQRPEPNLEGFHQGFNPMGIGGKGGDQRLPFPREDSD